jgi:3-methylcrotonyl-CoA carboxylase alpha subunit
MPGRVVRVLVKPGDQIAAGQPLVVIEAMKMENALRAGRSGVVADVRIAEGSLVEAQTVMVVLEPMGSADTR